ncbi:hypothetical protein PMI18_00643 [Pseudomonas sp. GM102]|nr:hypothetical protein PMI18_00643 [Pseudomonas sp. GM102]
MSENGMQKISYQSSVIRWSCLSPCRCMREQMRTLRYSIFLDSMKAGRTLTSI